MNKKVTMQSSNIIISKSYESKDGSQSHDHPKQQITHGWIYVCLLTVWVQNKYCRNQSNRRGIPIDLASTIETSWLNQYRLSCVHDWLKEHNKPNSFVKGVDSIACLVRKNTMKMKMMVNDFSDDCILALTVPYIIGSIVPPFQLCLIFQYNYCFKFCIMCTPRSKWHWKPTFSHREMLSEAVCTLCFEFFNH